LEVLGDADSGDACGEQEVYDDDAWQEVLDVGLAGGALDETAEDGVESEHEDHRLRGAEDEHLRGPRESAEVPAG
jgi:hypothetical protein